MAFTKEKLRELTEARRFDFDVAQIGRIKVNYLGPSDKSRLVEKIGDIDSSSATKVAAALLSVVSTRIRENDGNQAEEVPLGLEEIQKLSEAELEGFAEEFLKRNQNWLLIDPYNPKISFRTGEDGKQTEVVEIGNADLPRGDGESAVDYLKRVLSFYLKEEERRLESLAGLNNRSLKSLEAGMPPDVRRLMNDNRGIAGRLGESVARDVLYDRSSFREISLLQDSASMRSEHQARLTAQTNERLNTLIESFGALHPVVTNSAELLQNMNALGLGLAAQFKASSAESARQNGRMLRIALWTLIVSVALTALGLFLSYRSYRVAVESNAQSKAFTGAIADQSKLMRDMFSASAASRERDRRLGDLLRRQAEALERLKTLDPRAPEAKTLASRLQELNNELSRELGGTNGNINER